MQGLALAGADQTLPIADLKQCAVGSTADEGAIIIQKSILFPLQRGRKVWAAIVVEMQLFVLLYGKQKRAIDLEPFGVPSPISSVLHKVSSGEGSSKSCIKSSSSSRPTENLTIESGIPIDALRSAPIS